MGAQRETAAIAPGLPVTLSLGEDGERQFAWIDCTHSRTLGRVVLLAPRAPLGGRLRGRLAEGEVGYLTYEQAGAVVALKGAAKASGPEVAFLLLDPDPSTKSQTRPLPTPEPLLRLMYVSQAARGLEQADSDSILAASIRRNAEAAVTGALCLREGFFGQILEGPEPAVRATYQRIAGDHRHNAPLILLEERPFYRLYGGWAMKGISAENEITAADELAARLQLAGREDSAELTRRWLALLAVDSGPSWRDEWLASRQSVLVLRSLLEQAAPPAAGAPADP
jgi:hypothetical protein